MLPCQTIKVNVFKNAICGKFPHCVNNFFHFKWIIIRMLSLMFSLFLFPFIPYSYVLWWSSLIVVQAKSSQASLSNGVVFNGWRGLPLDTTSTSSLSILLCCFFNFKIMTGDCFLNVDVFVSLLQCGNDALVYWLPLAETVGWEKYTRNQLCSNPSSKIPGVISSRKQSHSPCIMLGRGNKYKWHCLWPWVLWWSPS